MHDVGGNGPMRDPANPVQVPCTDNDQVACFPGSGLADHVRRVAYENYRARGHTTLEKRAARNGGLGLAKPHVIVAVSIGKGQRLLE